MIGVAAFLRANWKPVAVVIAVGASWWAFTAWRDNLIATADAAGFARAEQQFTAAVEAANERERQTQVRLDQMTLNFGHLATQREQGITLSLAPQIERIEREVSTDPRYRECSVSDGVRDDLNAGRAAVDAGIAASDPQTDRP